MHTELSWQHFWQSLSAAVLSLVLSVGVSLCRQVVIPWLTERQRRIRSRGRRKIR